MKKILVFDEPEVISFINGAIGDRVELVWTSKEEEILPLYQKEKPDALLLNHKTTEEGFHLCDFGRVVGAIHDENPKVLILLMSEPKAVLDIPSFVKGGLFKPLKKESIEHVLGKYKLL